MFNISNRYSRGIYLFYKTVALFTLEILKLDQYGTRDTAINIKTVESIFSMFCICEPPGTTTGEKKISRFLP